jgi:FkbM family methyltransferase
LYDAFIAVTEKGDALVMSLMAVLKNSCSRLLPERIWRGILQRYYFQRLLAYRKSNEWESKERDLEVVKHLVAEGDSIVDVGANFGFYTAYLSGLAGNRGRIVSFEPIPLTFEILKYNIHKLSLDNARAINCALSDRDGVADMAVPKFESGGENYYQARVVPSDLEGKLTRRVKVDSKKLDSLFADHSEKIDFVKIDVEGHELQAIQGGISTIRRFKPALLIEVSGNPDDDRSAAAILVNLLRHEGYGIYWYDGERLKSRSTGDESVNYFFLTEDQIRRLKVSMRGRIEMDLK